MNKWKVLEEMVDSRTAIQVKAVIERRVSNCQNKKRLALEKNLRKFTKTTDEARDTAWAENSSYRMLSTAELNELNYNLGNTTSTEYLTEL